MTVVNRIKAELMGAESVYLYYRSLLLKEFPNGVNFCGETVSSKAATMCISLYRAEGRYLAIADLVNPTPAYTEKKATEIIERWNAAVTDEAINKAEKEYFKLWTIKKEN